MADLNLKEFNDKSFDILAEIADPFFKLMEDKEFARLYLTNIKDAVVYACKEHREEVVTIAAALKGVPVDEYVVNPFVLPLTLIAAMGSYSKITADLFTSQAQNSEEASSGSATENTEAIVQPINS